MSLNKPTIINIGDGFTIEEKLNQAEILRYALENNIIDLSYVQEKIEMAKREELLEKHPYKISQGKDGKWRTYIPDKESGRKMIKKNSKKVVEDAVISFWKAEMENPTVKDIFKEWIERKLEIGEIKKPTYERYSCDFERYFQTFGERKIKCVTEDEVEDFIIDCITQFHLTQKGYSNLRTIIYGVFKRARKKKYVQFGITEVINNMDISRKIFKSGRKADHEEVFDDEEFEQLEKCLMKNPDLTNLGLLLMLFTGIRVGELAVLKWDDYDGNSIHIRRTETRFKDDTGKYVYDIKESPKTEAGIREVVLPPQCKWIIRKIRYINPFGEYMFEKDGNRMKTYSFRKRLYYLCDEIGILRRSPHKIRKTYASILLDNHVSEKVIIDLMGHTDIKCTNKYYGRNRKTNEKKAEILNSIPEFQINMQNNRTYV